MDEYKEHLKSVLNSHMKRQASLIKASQNVDVIPELVQDEMVFLADSIKNINSELQTDKTQKSTRATLRLSVATQYYLSEIQKYLSKKSDAISEDVNTSSLIKFLIRDFYNTHIAISQNEALPYLELTRRINTVAIKNNQLDKIEQSLTRQQELQEFGIEGILHLIMMQLPDATTLKERHSIWEAGTQENELLRDSLRKSHEQRMVATKKSNKIMD
ncbi:hypothetical protein EQG49_00315 [Periweissella cryptocerci]|uniref:Uncharacterized protein n=1 Tax=Periweissella cryptocerci TaxID=2506420 RepID=A0A4P6YQW3_9LACO|nr:hypothetical protein [Periweissella cryptocerci]QBO34998.1 hypothetical protein EQG49_00315 [Periweissella cryptocerci]